MTPMLINNGDDGSPAPEIKALIERLTGLLAKAEVSRLIGDAHHSKDYAGRTHGYILCPGELVPVGAVVLGVEGMSHDQGRSRLTLLVEAVNALPTLLSTITALQAWCDALEGALTPSAETKAAYIGEIKYSYVDYDEFGDEQAVTRTLEWTTTKEVMAMIRAQAALAGGRG